MGLSLSVLTVEGNTWTPQACDSIPTSAQTPASSSGFREIRGREPLSGGPTVKAGAGRTSLTPWGAADLAWSLQHLAVITLPVEGNGTGGGPAVHKKPNWGAERPGQGPRLRRRLPAQWLIGAIIVPLIYNSLLNPRQEGTFLLPHPGMH